MYEQKDAEELTPKNNESGGFCIRLRVWIEKALNTNQSCLTTCLHGREVTIKPLKDSQLLSKVNHIVLAARGFATEPEARAFGEQLRTNLHLAALCSRFGVDTGEDNELGWINENFLRSSGALPPHVRFRIKDVHGLLIHPDDNTDTRFMSMSKPSVTVASDPAPFLDAMRELAEQPPLTESTILPVRLLNLAYINPQPLARIVLAFSAVETVAQKEDWSVKQRTLIDKLATEITNHAGSDREDKEVAEALMRTHKFGVRQGVMRVLDRNSLKHLRKEWDNIYSLRSGFFHGSKQLTEQEVNEFAAKALELCSKIILGIIRRKGTNLPPVTSKKFGDI